MEKERPIDIILNKKFNIKGFEFEVVDLLFVIAMWLIAIIARVQLFPIASGDFTSYNYFMEQIQDKGLSVAGTEYFSYPCSHLYLMYIVQAITDEWLSGLKVLSIIFEYFTSVTVFMIVYHITKNTRKSIAGMAFILFSPSVVINGAYWGQCDIINTSFIMLAFLFLLKKKGNLAMIMIGIAVSFKLQAVFILPFLIILWFRKHVVKLIHFLWIPVVYFISILPSWFSGSDLMSLLGFYSVQSNSFPWGTLEYPNFYALLDENMTGGHYMNEVSGAGLYVTIILLGIICYYVYVKKVEMNSTNMILLSLLTILITLYMLPHMHDRYGFLSDLIVVVYATVRPRRIPLMCGFFLVSVLSYMPYLTGVHVLPIQVVALMETVLIGIVAYDFYKSSKISSVSNS